jgi:hypothetical protein
MKCLAAASLFLALSCLVASAQTVALTSRVPTTITTGGIFQTILPAVTNNNQRRSLQIETIMLRIAAGSTMGSA